MRSRIADELFQIYYASTYPRSLFKSKIPPFFKNFMGSMHNKRLWMVGEGTCILTSLGMNSSMFGNCSVFCDVWHVWCSVLGQNVMFRSGVWSLVLLLCDQTCLGTYSLMFTNCSVFCDVWHFRSLILGQNVMFRKFDVWTFNVRSVWSSVFWCSFQD